LGGLLCELCALCGRGGGAGSCYYGCCRWLI
jgi:hypothetical protein